MQEVLTNNSPRLHENFSQVVKSYYQLTKPRIILLLLITTSAGMWMAAKGEVDPLLLVSTITGGALASASANTINCVYDSDIDYIMERTRWRPIPSGRVKKRDALIFAIALATISFTLLTVVANLLAALLAMSGIVFYVLIYTHWLKRHSVQNIVIGGAAGAIPPLSWVGCGDGRFELGCVAAVWDYLPVDAATFLGLSNDDSRGIQGSRCPDVAGN